MKVQKILKKPVTKQKAGPVDDGPVLTLPTEKTVPRADLQDYSALIYGKKKVGKTTLASMFANAFFMLCEPGGKALSIYSRPVRNWIEVKQYIRLIQKDKKFANVVIDTGDYFYEYCSEFICKKHAIDHPSDEPWGKGWKAVKAEMSAEINKLLHSGKGVIIISHAREEEVDKREGGTYQRTTSTLSGQAKELLEGLVDIWGYYTYKDNERVLVIQGDDFIDAGHRIEGRFQYPDGTPIKEIPMGKNKEEAYGNFLLAFNNKLPKPAMTLVKKPAVVLKKKVVVTK